MEKLEYFIFLFLSISFATVKLSFYIHLKLCSWATRKFSVTIYLLYIQIKTHYQWRRIFFHLLFLFIYLFLLLLFNFTALWQINFRKKKKKKRILSLGISGEKLFVMLKTWLWLSQILRNIKLMDKWKK